MKKWNTDEEYATLFERFATETLSSLDISYVPDNLFTKEEQSKRNKEIMKECEEHTRNHFKEIFGVYPEEEYDN